MNKLELVKTLCSKRLNQSSIGRDTLSFLNKCSTNPKDPSSMTWEQLPEATIITIILRYYSLKDLEEKERIKIIHSERSMFGPAISKEEISDTLDIKEFIFLQLKFEMKIAGMKIGHLGLTEDYIKSTIKHILINYPNYNIEKNL